MAGKGRGVAAFTFNIEALGIGRGSMPEARVGPSPLFPVSTERTHARTHARTHTHTHKYRSHDDISHCSILNSPISPQSVAWHNISGMEEFKPPTAAPVFVDRFNLRCKILHF